MHKIFFVTATRDIGHRIKQGDHVKIDPAAVPCVGQLVLVENEIRPWTSRTEGIRGVAVAVQRDL